MASCCENAVRTIPRMRIRFADPYSQSGRIESSRPRQQRGGQSPVAAQTKHFPDHISENAAHTRPPAPRDRDALAPEVRTAFEIGWSPRALTTAPSEHHLTCNPSRTEQSRATPEASFHRLLESSGRRKGHLQKALPDSHTHSLRMLPSLRGAVPNAKNELSTSSASR